MATTVTSTSNYAGKEAGKIIGKAFREAKTISSGFVTVNENVNSKLHLRKIQTTGGRRAYTCGFVPAGAITLTEKTLEPKKFKDDFEVCLEDFRNQWNDGDLGESAWNDGNMKLIMDAIIADKLAAEAFEQETILWQGVDTNADEYNGYLTLFEADANIITVDGATITEANFEAEVKKAINAVPYAMRNKPIRVGVSSNIMTQYSFLLISKGILNGLGGDANTTLKFGKYILEELPGLPDNNMVIAEPENLVFGTGKSADFNEIRMVNTNESLLDGKVRGSMVYNAGVEYYNAEEIVWYRPASQVA